MKCPVKEDVVEVVLRWEGLCTGQMVPLRKAPEWEPEGESVHHRLGLCPGSPRAHLWGNPMQSRDQRDLLLSPCQLVPRTQPFTNPFILISYSVN